MKHYHPLYLTYIISLSMYASHASEQATAQLFVAISNEDVYQAIHCILAGANINKLSNGLGTPLHYAAFIGNLPLVAILLANKANIHAEEKNDKETPLHKAAAQGYTSVVLELLKAKASVGKQDWLGNTPLHHAARAGHLNTVKVIIAACMPHQIHITNTAKATALHEAQRNGHETIADLLKSYKPHNKPPQPYCKIL